MKLSELLDVLDPLSDLVVWTKDQEELEEDDPAFKGIALDCPYWLSKYNLYSGLDDGDCMISVRKDFEKDNAVLVVSVEEG